GPTRPTVGRGRRRARLGTYTRRIRRHDNVRGQLPRAHPDHPAGRLYRIGEPTRGGHRSEPRATGRLAYDPLHHARAVARAAMSLEAHIRLRRGTFELDAELKIDAGET